MPERQLCRVCLSGVVWRRTRSSSRGHVKPAQPPTDLRELAGGSRLRTLSLTALLRSILRLSRPLFELDRR